MDESDLAQKTRLAKQIPDREFDRLAEAIIREDKNLLEMLARV